MSSTPSKSTPTPLSRNGSGRKTGAQERPHPLDTAYYDLLGVPVDATTDDIKRAYRYLTIRHVFHEDRYGRLDPNAEERLGSISIAYQTLSDPQLRHKYNEFGPKESTPEGGFVDPEEVYGLILGGERFFPLIGPLDLRDSISQCLKSARQGTNTTEDGIATPSQRDYSLGIAARIRADAVWNARVQKLVENLCNKLDNFTENATSPTDPDVTESWRRTCSLEAEELKGECYGVELLNLIGSVYAAKAREFLIKPDQSFLGFCRWLKCMQWIVYHFFSCIVSTLRSAKQCNGILDQIQQGEISGILSAEERKHLEEQATEKGLQCLFSTTKIEIRLVLQDTCNLVLYGPTIVRHRTAVLRATALQTLGDVFMAVRNE